MPDSSALVYLGKISKPHGIRGELVMHCVAQSSDILLGAIFVGRPLPNGAAPTSMRQATVEKIRIHHGTVLLTIAGNSTRNHAEEWRGLGVYVLRDKFPPLTDDEYYFIDLLGFNVIVASPNGQESHLGKIVSIDAPSGQELWSIETPEGKEVLFPAVPEFILNINLDKNQAIINPPPGLIELYIND